MRTDVKIGLICVFAGVLGVVIYFVAVGNNNPRPAKGDSTLSHNLATPSGTGTSSLAIAPATTAPSLVETTLAQATPPGAGAPLGGDLIGVPSSPSASIGPSTLPSYTPPTTSSSLTSSGLVPGTPTTAPSNSHGNTFGSATLTPGTPSMSHSTFSDSGNSRTYGSGLTGTGSTGSGLTGSGLTGSGLSGSSHSGSSFSSSSLTGSGLGSSSPSTYKIEKGDMLSTIAKKFNVTVKAIEAANPGIDSTRLKIGKEIKIPAAGSAISGSSVTPPSSLGLSSPTDSTTSTPTTKPSKKTRSAAPTVADSASAAKPGSSYTVKKGDTLGKIAQEVYGDKNAWKRIFRANRTEIPDPDTVPIGAVLRLPS
jgi:LysM repeat protein